MTLILRYSKPKVYMKMIKQDRIWFTLTHKIIEITWIGGLSICMHYDKVTFEFKE